MSTAVAPAAKRALTIKELLKHEGFQQEVAKMLPKHCNPDRMMRVALATLTKTPKLANCTQASFVKCMIDCSQWGLEPDGRRAHLIPYGTECTLIIDYKGYVELAYRSGHVKKLHSAVVYEGDIFEYDLGEVKHHVPWYLRRDDDKPSEQGDVIAAFSMGVMKDDVQQCEVLPKSDVDAIRKRSKASASGPWVTDWNEMAKKTAFRRLSKWLPLSAEIIDAMDADADNPMPLMQSAHKQVHSSDLMEQITAEGDKPAAGHQSENEAHVNSPATHAAGDQNSEPSGGAGPVGEPTGSNMPSTTKSEGSATEDGPVEAPACTLPENVKLDYQTDLNDALSSDNVWSTFNVYVATKAGAENIDWLRALADRRAAALGPKKRGSGAKKAAQQEIDMGQGGGADW